MSANLKINLDKSKPLIKRSYKLVARSATDIILSIYDDGVVYDASDLTCTLIVANKELTWEKAINGVFVEDNLLRISIGDNDLDLSGNHQYEIRVFEDGAQFINQYGELAVIQNANGSGGLPEPSNGLDWSIYTFMLGVLEHGPYNFSGFDTNVESDGRVTITFDDSEIVGDIEQLEIDLNAHIDDTNNPHNVTPEQIGLGDVDNTADVDKPVSTAQQEALDAKAELDGGNTFDASPQILEILRALGATGLVIQDTSGNEILRIGDQTVGTDPAVARALKITGLLETSGGSVIGSTVTAFSAVRAGGVANPAGAMRSGAADSFVVESQREGGGIIIRGRQGGHTTGDITLGGLGEAIFFPDFNASLPLALDANKRAVTLSAEDFRSLIDALGVTAQAADVDPEGAAIAEALAGKLSLNPDANITQEIKNLLGFVSTRFVGTATYLTLERLDETLDSVFAFRSEGVNIWQAGLKFTNQTPEMSAFVIRDMVNSRTPFWVSAVSGRVHAPHGLTLDGLTASLPLALDANKRAVTLSAADFRTLIGLVIGTDVQAQDSDLQAYADAADAAARRDLIGAAKASVLPDYIGGTHALTISSGVVTPDAEDGHSQKLTLTEDVTDFELPDNLADGHSINIVGLQDGTGERAFNPAGAYRIMGASPADVSALGADKAFQLGVTRNGSLYNLMIAVENDA